MAFLAWSILALLPLAGAPQQGTETQGPDDYIEVWLCPLHSDEQAFGRGQCSICERPFEKRLLVSVWACPMHNHIQGEEEDKCPICGMNLARTTQEFEWFCPDHSDVVQHTAGACPRDGQKLERRTVLMPHGDHNPRHGGLLFMAPDGFHHLEGTFSREGIFRLYLYDNFTQPTPASAFSARIGDRPLGLVSGGEYLELPLTESFTYPVEVVLHVDFPDGEVEERFDFIFLGDQAEALPSLGEFYVPESSDEIVAEIFKRDSRLKELIERGVWTDLFIPALEAKDLALALSGKGSDRMDLAVKTLVRAAWLLDMYGDLGNRLRVEDAYRLFDEGIQELRSGYAR